MPTVSCDRNYLFKLIGKESRKTNENSLEKQVSSNTEIHPS